MSLAVVGLLAVLVGRAAAQGPWIDGVATFTLGPDAMGRFPTELPAGACGYGTLKEADYPGFPLVGISRSSIFQNRPMGGCGACIEVRCTDKQNCVSTQPIVVQVTDACDDNCGVNQLNLKAKAFSAIAPLELGRTAIMYREVPCSFKGGIVVNVDSYRATDGGWMRLSFRNVAGPGDITSVSISKAGTEQWRPMKNSYGAQWEASLLPAPPLSLKITTASGQSVVLGAVIAKAGQTGLIPTSVQFTPGGSQQAAKPVQAAPIVNKPQTQQQQQPAGPPVPQGMQAVPVMLLVPAGTPVPSGPIMAMPTQQQGGMQGFPYSSDMGHRRS